MGVEKLKDTGFAGLPVANRGTLAPQYLPTHTNPGNFAQLAGRYRARHGIDRSDLKRAMAHVSVKSHANAVSNPKAHLRKAITIDQAINAPIIAGEVGLFDCCPVSDGAACAIVTTPEIAAARLQSPLITVKALQVATSDGNAARQQNWDGSHVETAQIAAAKAYQEAEISVPRDELSFVELHDCFSITEIVTLEDLCLSEPGKAWADMLDGRFDAGGALPCQIDGGLKCFGHPVGASGLRMLYEGWLQLSQRAGARQLREPRLALTHNLGGAPAQSVCAIAIIGAN
jgi:acetyl-CoA C-acetyltransferase